MLKNNLKKCQKINWKHRRIGDQEMIFTIIIILILVFGFTRGLHKGLVVEILNLAGILLSTVVGFIYTSPIAEFALNWLNHGNSTLGTQRAVKWLIFGILVIGVWQIVRLVKSILIPVTKLPVIHQLNALLGGGINVLSSYLLIFFLLNLLLMIPNQAIVNQYEQSTVSQWIVKQTPILSDKMIQIWDEHSNEV